MFVNFFIIQRNQMLANIDKQPASDTHFITLDGHSLAALFLYLNDSDGVNQER